MKQNFFFRFLGFPVLQLYLVHQNATLSRPPTEERGRGKKTDSPYMGQCQFLATQLFLEMHLIGHL